MSVPCLCIPCLYVPYKCCVSVFFPFIYQDEWSVKIRTVLRCPPMLIIPSNGVHNETLRRGFTCACCRCHGKRWCVIEAWINVFIIPRKQNCGHAERHGGFQAAFDPQSNRLREHTLLIHTGDSSLLAPAVSLSSAVRRWVVENKIRKSVG